MAKQLIDDTTAAQIAEAAAAPIRADLASRSSLGALSLVDVTLTTDTAAPETVVPAGRTLSGHAILTTPGVVVQSGGTLKDITIVGTTGERSALIIPGNSTAAPVWGVSVTQPGTTSAAVLIQEGGHAALSNVNTRGGQFGVNATLAARVAFLNVRTEDAGTGVLIYADGVGKTMWGSTVLGGVDLNPTSHGVQVWGGDAAVDPVLRQHGVSVIGRHVKNAVNGAGIWATNTLGLAFVGNTVEKAALEGYDVENVDTFAFSGNTAVDAAYGAATVLYGSRNGVISGEAFKLTENRNLSGGAGSADAIAGTFVLIADDSEHLLISGITTECRVKDANGALLPLMGKVQLTRRGKAVGPKSITFVGCKFRNTCFDIADYVERLEFIDCVSEYDFDFVAENRPIKIEKGNKILLDGLTLRLLGPATARSGGNESPIFITQNAEASAAGAPMVTEVCVRDTRVLGWGENAGVTVTTWRGGAGPADNSRLVFLNNAVAAIYVSGTNPTRRVAGNYHPETLADVAVTTV